MPFLPRQLLYFAVAIEIFADSAPAIYEHARIPRIVQNPEHMAVLELAPDHVAFTGTRMDTPGKQQTEFAKFPHGRHRRASSLEYLKQHTNRVLNLLVRIQPQASDRIVSEADWRAHKQFATRCFVQNPALQPCSQHMEFGFAHRALQAEQQPIIEMSGIVDSILVENQGIGQSADLEQSMPIH